MTPELALRDIIIELLNASPAVMDAVQGRIYDEVPSDTQGRTQRHLPAYIYIGPMNRTRIRQDCAQMWTMRARIYVISDGWGRTEAWDTAEAVVQAVDEKGEADFTLAPPFVISEDLHVTQAGDVIDPQSPKSVFVDITTTIIRSPEGTI